MANNRYYMQCKCGTQFYIGKSLGQGIYHGQLGSPDMWTTPEEYLAELHKFMWEHLIDCYGDEWIGGEIFKVVTEYPAEV